MSIDDDRSSTWIRACSVAEVESGEAVQLDTEPPIAVFNVDGQWFATDDTCTHAESSLADGYIDGDVVECAFHFAKFCIRSGAALTPPAVVPLRTHEVALEGDVVWVRPDTSPGEGPA